MTENKKLDQEIQSIEEELIEYLVESPLFMGEDIILRNIRAYFRVLKALGKGLGSYLRPPSDDQYPTGNGEN